MMAERETYRRTYRLGELPQWVVSYAEGAAAYIDTQAGRYHLKPGDTILYDADWNALDVVRAAPQGGGEQG